MQHLSIHKYRNFDPRWPALSSRPLPAFRPWPARERFVFSSMRVGPFFAKVSIELLMKIIEVAKISFHTLVHVNMTDERFLQQILKKMLRLSQVALT